MNPYFATPEPEVKPPSTGGYEPEYTRSTALKAALSYARRGKPIFPVKHAPAKTPLTMNGFKDATTDAARVHAYWTSKPSASIGMPTGAASGVFVVDVDRLSALGELPGELPPTLTAKTPRPGLHMYFQHVEGITNSSGSLPKGLDVRGTGGYVLLSPSPGYSWVDRSPVAEAPPWLIEMIVKPKNPKPPRRNDDTGQPALDLDGPPIIEGTRHTTMLSLGGRLHDGHRTAEELQRDLLSINGDRCLPPLPVSEVTSIAAWTSEKEPCSSGRPPELEAMIDRLSESWFRLERRGLGGKNEVRMVRLLLEEGNRIGTVVEDGLRVSISLRQISEKLSCSLSTVVAVRDRLAAKGLLRLDRSELGRRTATGTSSAAIVLIVAHQRRYAENRALPASWAGRVQPRR